MSLLLLTFRKLSLKRKINNGNYRLMTLQMKQDKIQSQIAEHQKLDASLKDGLSSFSSLFENANASITNARYNYSNQNIQDAIKAYEEACKTNDKDKIASADAAMKLAESNEMAQQKIYLQQHYSQAVDISNMKQAINSIFEFGNEAMLTKLQQEDQSIELEKTSLEDQMTSWNSEYSSLEKAVSEAAKNEAPKYC